MQLALICFLNFDVQQTAFFLDWRLYSYRLAWHDIKLTSVSPRSINSWAVFLAGINLFTRKWSGCRRDYPQVTCRWWPSPCGHFHFCRMSLMRHRPEPQRFPEIWGARQWLIQWLIKVLRIKMASLGYHPHCLDKLPLAKAMVQLFCAMGRQSWARRAIAVSTPPTRSVTRHISHAVSDSFWLSVEFPPLIS